MAQGGKATLAGVAYGMGAAALWGLVFLAPQLASAFGPLQLTIGRYLAYGLLSLVLIAPRRRMLASHLARHDGRELALLALLGNTLYYVLLSAAVQAGGIAMTSLVIGFLPVAVTIIGRRDADAVPLRRLLPSLFLCGAGAICVGWQAFALLGSASIEPLIGLVCAIGALASWTAYAVRNSRALARLDAISAHDWSLLIGIATGAQCLLLLPPALLLENWRHGAPDWLLFAGVSVGVALLASIAGNALWNRMSRLLPLALTGQMILFETLFALLYAFWWEQRGPTALEAAAFGFVVASVLACIAAHGGAGARRAKLAREAPE